MFLIDSHCHLDHDPIPQNLGGVLKRAEGQNVKGFLTICTELSKGSSLKKLAETYKNVFCTLGVHPHEAEQAPKSQEIFKVLVQESLHPKVVGFGETGLDFYYTHSPRKVQEASFSAHIEAAIKQDLPLVIHTRNAEKETIDLLKSVGEGKARGVFHCFSGSAWLRDQALELGFYLSASGIITFKKADDLRSVFKGVPLEKLLVETDAPWLAPEPYRGKSNEPAFMVETAKKLADLKEVSYEDLAAHTTRNFLTLFSKVTLPCV